MMALLALGTVLVRRIAILPCLNLGLNVQEASLVDTMFRRKSILAILNSVLVAFFIVGMVQSMLITGNLPKTIMRNDLLSYIVLAVDLTLPLVWLVAPLVLYVLEQAPRRVPLARVHGAR